LVCPRPILTTGLTRNNIMNKQELEYKTKIILDDDTIEFEYEKIKQLLL